MSHFTDVSVDGSYAWHVRHEKKQMGDWRRQQFCEVQKLPLSVYLQILFLFAHNVRSDQAVNMLAEEDGADSIYTWYNFYWDIRPRTLLEAPVKLGVPKTIVEMDERK